MTEQNKGDGDEIEAPKIQDYSQSLLLDESQGLLTIEEELDRALNKIGGFGRFQCIFCLCLIFFFILGSQFFYSFPFYQYYPKIICIDQNDQDYYCQKEIACNAELTKSYTFDYSSPFTLHNLMTDYGLLCSEPYEIGLMASINFVGFTAGSLLFVRLADLYGRKPVALVATSITPIGILCMIFYGNSLINIYIIVFIMGLTYSTRASVSYLLAVEYLTEKNQMMFGVTLFGIDGCFTIMTSVFFRVFKYQVYYMSFLCTALIICIIIVALFAPESPKYLLSKMKFDELRNCLTTIAKINGKYDQKLIYQLMDRLQSQLQNDVSATLQEQQALEQLHKQAGMMTLFRTPILRKNLIAVTLLWASQSFSAYLIQYYTKYFQGNFFINYAVLGIADGFSFLLAKLLQNRFSVPQVIRLLLFGIIIGCFLFAFLSGPFPIIIPFLIILIRLNISSILNYGYYLNSFLFPILLRGNVYAITNFVARPFAAVATITAEYTRDPMSIVLFVSILSTLATLLISKPNEKLISQFTPKESAMISFIKMQKSNSRLTLINTSQRVNH